MLVALLPSQVPDYWEVFMGHVHDSLPPIGDYGTYDLNNILHSLMIGGMQCWLVTDKEQVLVGFIITTLLRDVSGVVTLLIYNMIVLRQGKQEDWTEGLHTLITYGRSKGCSKIAAFVANEKLLTLLEEAGAETRFVYVNYNI